MRTKQLVFLLTLTLLGCARKNRPNVLAYIPEDAPIVAWLPSEEADHAFDPFYRSSTRGASIGVGLGVARSVAATLGGEVSLAPRQGGGAVITMRLRATVP